MASCKKLVASSKLIELCADYPERLFAFAIIGKALHDFREYGNVIPEGKGDWKGNMKKRA